MIDDIVADMWSEGYTEDEIIDRLLDEDYSLNEIMTALGYAEVN